MARSMIARQNLKLNLVPGGVPPVLNVSQNDSAYDVHFTLYNGAQLFEIPDDVSIQFVEKKRDGNGYDVGATKSAQTGQCYIWMQKQMTAVPGDQICELILTNTTEDQIGTANFIMRVEPGPVDDDTSFSDSDIAYANQVLAQLGSVAAYKEQLDAQGNEIDQLNTDLAAEVTARQAADNTLQSNINSEASTRATADAALQSQINQLIAPEGAAPSAAEIENARVGADGTVYPTLGDAIRTQDTQLKNQIDASNNDIFKLIGNVQGTWNLGGMYSATGIEYNSSNHIRTPFIKVNPGDTIQIENPDTTLQLSVYEFASNTPTTSGTNERLQITYADSSVKSVTLGDSTYYIRLQLPTDDTLKGDDLLLYTKNSVVFNNIKNTNEKITGTVDNVKIAEAKGNLLWLFNENPLPSVTTNGVTYTYHTDTDTFTVDGSTTTTVSFYAFLTVASDLDTLLQRGQSYNLDYISDDANVLFNFAYQTNGTWAYLFYTESAIIHIPNNATDVLMRLYVPTNKTVSNATVKARLSVRDDTFAEQLGNNITRDVLYGIQMDAVTQNGIDYRKKIDGSYQISGTVANGVTTFADIYRNKTQFPEGIDSGDDILVYVKSEQFYIRVVSYTSESDNGTVLWQSPKNAYKANIKKVKIPDDATGIDFRIHYINSTGAALTVSETMTVKCWNKADADGLIGMFNSVVNESAVRLRCVGNSFMGGAVWENNAYSHLSAYENTIYGRIAQSMNIPECNVDFSMYSSTGLISPPTGGSSFLDIICASSLAGYDYLVTQFNGTDLSAHSIGTADSTDNDGTLAGAVIHLVNYIKQSNGLCKLILFSTPPYESNPAYSGSLAFTGTRPNGNSIDMLDNVMYALAKKLHFIYISWQDLEISYHYMDYADYEAGVTTGARHAKDEAVYRALGNYVVNQIGAVSSPIAIGKLL